MDWHVNRVVAQLRRGYELHEYRPVNGPIWYRLEHPDGGKRIPVPNAVACDVLARSSVCFRRVKDRDCPRRQARWIGGDSVALNWRIAELFDRYGSARSVARVLDLSVIEVKTRLGKVPGE